MMRYVVGLMFSPDRQEVVLIEKARPDWQRGLLNGVGGKIEPKEQPSAAMAREFHEETGVMVGAGQWQPVAVLQGDDFVLNVFATFSDKVRHVRSMTDERIIVLPVSRLPANSTLANLPLLIALALDDSGIVKPVVLSDDIPERSKAA